MMFLPIYVNSIIITINYILLFFLNLILKTTTKKIVPYTFVSLFKIAFKIHTRTVKN